MKTRPTLFKPEMVNAIKNTEVGIWPPRPIDPAEPFKSHTRRLRGLEEINGVQNAESWGRPDDWAFGQWVKGKVYFVKYENGNVRAIAPPLGLPGDFIYVREGWRYAYNLVKGFSEEAENHIQFKADGWIYEIKMDMVDGSFYLEKFPNQDKQGGQFPTHKDFGKWKPSIHMFKYMSRFLLEIKDVSVERLKDITESDAKREGVKEAEQCDHKRRSCKDVGCYGNGYRATFGHLWDSINAKTGFTWEYNPWVFKYEFMVKEANV